MTIVGLRARCSARSRFFFFYPIVRPGDGCRDTLRGAVASQPFWEKRFYVCLSSESVCGCARSSLGRNVHGSCWKRDIDDAVTHNILPGILLFLDGTRAGLPNADAVWLFEREGGWGKPCTEVFPKLLSVVYLKIGAIKIGGPASNLLHRRHSDGSTFLKTSGGAAPERLYGEHTYFSNATRAELSRSSFMQVWQRYATLFVVDDSAFLYCC